MASDPNQPVVFSHPAADKIVTATKLTLAQPNGNAGSRTQQRVNDNRFFWATVATTSLTEVYPTQVCSSGPTPTPTGQLTYNSVTGGRTGFLAYGAEMGDPLAFPSGATPTAQLIRQDFDCTVNPPEPIYSPCCSLIMVNQLASSSSIPGGIDTDFTHYTGTIGGTTAPCKVIDINSAVITGVGNIGSAPVGDVFGMIVGQSNDDPSQTVVLVGLEYQAKVVYVALTITSGSNGTDPTFSGGTYTAATAPTYVYTANAIGGPLNGTAIGTGLTPLKRRVGACSPPGKGTGWINAGTFVLFDAGE